MCDNLDNGKRFSNKPIGHSKKMRSLGREDDARRLDHEQCDFSRHRNNGSASMCERFSNEKQLNHRSASIHIEDGSVRLLNFDSPNVFDRNASVIEAKPGQRRPTIFRTRDQSEQVTPRK